VKWIITETNQVPDPTIKALALLSIKADSELEEADKATGWIAKLENTIRLACLDQIKELSKTQFNGDNALACEQLQPWFVEKTYSTFNELRQLQHCASAIAFGMARMLKVWWLD
jgi:hypothetical protein